MLYEVITAIPAACAVVIILSLELRDEPSERSAASAIAGVSIKATRSPWKALKKISWLMLVI